MREVLQIRILRMTSLKKKCLKNYDLNFLLRMIRLWIIIAIVSR
jgi:hypothetical protein